MAARLRIVPAVATDPTPAVTEPAGALEVSDVLGLLARLAARASAAPTSSAGRLQLVR